MKKQYQTFEFAKGKASPADPNELRKFRKAVREQVVKPIRERAAEQKAAVAKARARYVR